MSPEGSGRWPSGRAGRRPSPSPTTCTGRRASRSWGASPASFNPAWRSSSRRTTSSRRTGSPATSECRSPRPTAAPLGLLAALSRRPLHDGESAARALGLFAARAVAEIERREARIDEGRREEESRRLVASIPVGLHRYRLEGDGRLVFVGANPAADAILGVDNRQFVGRTIEEAFPDLAGTRIPEAYRRAASEGAPWRSEEVTYADGRIAGAFLVQAFQTAPSEMAAAFLDITARRRAEEALREREARLERLNRILRTVGARPGDPRRGAGAGRPDRARLRGARRGSGLRLRLGRPAGRSGNEVRLAGASRPCDPDLYRIDLRTLHGGPTCGKAAFLRGAAVLVDPDLGRGRPVPSVRRWKELPGAMRPRDAALEGRPGAGRPRRPRVRPAGRLRRRGVPARRGHGRRPRRRHRPARGRGAAGRGRRERTFRADVASAAFREESLPAAPRRRSRRPWSGGSPPRASSSRSGTKTTGGSRLSIGTGCARGDRVRRRRRSPRKRRVCLAGFRIPGGGGPRALVAPRFLGGS